MKLTEFADLVAKMRHAQKEYFRTRSTTALENSKRLEKKVDAAIKDVADGQQSLFGERDT